MMNRFPFLWFFFLLTPLSDNNAALLKINLICPENGKGLEVDGNILHKALTSLGCPITRLQGDEKDGIPLADINLFCEQLHPRLFPYARLNWFIPNPECYWQDIGFFDSIDLILCRTREVERIFMGLGKETFFLGFTTPDAQIPGVSKDYTAFIHVAGGSPTKGTWPITAAWQKNPSFPFLTVVSTREPLEDLPPNFIWLSERLSREELRLRQNQCGIHLCLSETEGFGHSLMEAMSCSAVVITTDAPPMNEFVNDPGCLVQYSYKSQAFLGTKYHVDSKAVEAKIYAILQLSMDELKAIGAKNRATYLKNDKLFLRNLKRLINETAKQKKQRNRTEIDFISPPVE